MTLFANLSRAQMDHVSVRRRRAVSTLEESMQLFAAWTAEEEQQPMQEEEAVPAVVPEPETPRPSLAALLSTRSDEQLAVVPAAPAARHASSCPDLSSLIAFLLQFKSAQVETLQNNRLALPAQVPKWMLAAREMDPPNSLVSTVSLPSNWDAPLSARLSSSSIFNLFSDPVPASDNSSIFNLFSDPVVPSPAPSLFAINPAGESSDASTVSVPTSFWDTPSTVSVVGAGASAVSIPSGFFGVRPVTSRSSSIRVEMSSDTSSASSLFADPREALSSTDSLFPDPRSTPASATGLCEDCRLALALNVIWNCNSAEAAAAAAETAAASSCDCKPPATEEATSTTSLHHSSTSKDSLLAGALHRMWNGLPASEDVNTPRTPSTACSCNESEEEEEEEVPEDPWHFAPDCPDCRTTFTSTSDAVTAAVEADDVTSSELMAPAAAALEGGCGKSVCRVCSECALACGLSWPNVLLRAQEAEAKAEDVVAVEEEEDHVSNASSGYETDVDSVEEPAVVLRAMTSATTSATTQSEAESKAAAARMIAECDEMLAKVAEMRRKLMELL